jgi:hypothetical protein
MQNYLMGMILGCPKEEDAEDVCNQKEQTSTVQADML